MIKIDRIYLYIKIGDIGCLKMDYGNDREDNKIDSYGFKVVTKDYDKGLFEQTLIPGTFINHNTFIERSIKVHFVEILSIQQIKPQVFSHNGSHVDGILKATLRVVNKDSDSSKEVNLSVMNKGNSPLDFMSLCPFVNFINKYIDKNKIADKLDIDKLIENSFGYRRPFELHSLVTKLKIELFEDSENRVGKDNYFWTEAVCTNIDKNDHFKALVTSFFDQVYKGVWTEDDKIVGTIDSHYGWAPYENRTLLNNKELETEIRVRLSIWLGQRFSFDEYTFKKFELTNTNSSK